MTTLTDEERALLIAALGAAWLTCRAEDAAVLRALLEKITAGGKVILSG